MKIHRIYALILRYWFYFKHSFDRLSDAFYWPMVDLLLWGITSQYIQQSNNIPDVILVIVSGILFWIIVWRGQYEITVNFLEELWNRNLVNLFVSPLSLQEWITSVLIMGIIKMSLSLSFASFMAFLLYKVNIFRYGFYLIPFIGSLLLTGWAVGLLISGIILRFGTKVQTLAWTAIMLISPFSAIYYPLSILPKWAQWIARFIPTSYIFEGGRSVIFQHKLDLSFLFKSYALNIIYLIFAIVFIYTSFKKAKDRGLIDVF